MDKENFQERVTIRLFTDERGYIKSVLFHARDNDGDRKYSSENHFIRCSIMKLLREERQFIKNKKRLK